MTRVGLIRYPGSKAKIADAILRRLPNELTLPLFHQEFEYREPFVGSGAIAQRALRALCNGCSVWLNDRDFWLVCLWKSILECPDELISKIQGYSPNTDDFYAFKEQDGASDVDVVECGFRKLVLHQISFSGLGFKAGGPLGGKDQSKAEYPVNCRWRPIVHIKNVKRLNRDMRRMSSVRITCGDFAKLIDGAPSNAFVYADPPYVEKGPELYKYGMENETDHRRLASSLRNTGATWVLSYDDDPLVRSLYQDWCRIEDIQFTYTTAVSQNRKRKNREVIITPHADTGRQKDAAE